MNARLKPLLAGACVVAVFAALCANAGANHNALDRVSVGPAGGNGSFEGIFRGNSADGSRVFFTTDESLVLADTDTSVDLYERVGSTTTKLSAGNGAFGVTFAGASPDGMHVFFDTEERLAATDTDNSRDLYQNSGGAVTHVSYGPFGGNAPGYTPWLLATSTNGARVLFQTHEQLVDEDNDIDDDIYQRAGGTTTLVSTGPADGTCGCGQQVTFDAASTDAARVVFHTPGQLVPEDTDTNLDLYARAGGTTSLLTPSNNANGNFFAGASTDATRVFFTTGEQLHPADTDGRLDIYEVGGTLISTGPAGGNGAFDPTFRGRSDDGTRVFFTTSESLVAADTDATGDIYERAGSTTTLITPGTANLPAYRGISSDGSHVFFVTNEPLVPGDTDLGIDVYQRAGGTTTLLSSGATGGNGPVDATFSGASSDGTRMFFTTGERLESADVDSSIDIYERFNGATTLLSTGPTDNNHPFQFNVFRGASADGYDVFFETGTPLVAGDTDIYRDVYAARYDDDLDGDGLLNDWETQGLEVGGDFIDLPAMGASPTHRDIFVEVDYMKSGTDHHKPAPSAIKKVVDAFDAAPTPNPDGTMGIHLHVDYGDTAPLTWGAAETWDTLSRSDELAHQANLGTGAATGADPYDWSAFDTIKAASFTPARAPVFHYNVWAHDLSMVLGSTSGMSRGHPASDFIVSLGSWGGGSADDQAGTFMHELGHNLGLGHGGADDVQWKPNYRSVMGYHFQTRGLIVDGKEGTFDFSREDLATLNEADLDEPSGIGMPEGTRYFCGLDDARIVLDASTVDWNCDADAGDEGVSANVNQGVTDNSNTTLDSLEGSDDWSNLVFDGGVVGLGGGSLPQSTVSNELTEEQDSAMPDLTPRYPRPKGASPLRVPLVPAYAQCTAPNRTHGAPLASPSCNPPQLRSAELTMGTPDANAHPANSSGFASYTVKPGVPGGADDADVDFKLNLTDVRVQGTLADYAGELQATAVARITDRANGPYGIEPGTMSDIPFSVTVPCTPTGGAADIGATCAVATSLDAVLPGVIPETKRVVWDLQRVEVFDGGPDGDAETGPNTRFAAQGIFVP